MARADFQQLDVRPLFDGIGHGVLASVDGGHKRDGLVKEPVERAR